MGNIIPKSVKCIHSATIRYGFEILLGSSGLGFELQGCSFSSFRGSLVKSVRFRTSGSGLSEGIATYISDSTKDSHKSG